MNNKNNIINLQLIFAYVLVLIGFVFVFIPNFEIFAVIGLGLGFVMTYREHRKNKRTSNRQKHTKKRAGKVYDTNRNEKRGNKNKKYKKKTNPNKKKKNEK